MSQAIILRAAILIILALYPLVVYFGIRSFPPSFFGILLGILVLLRFRILEPEERSVALPVTLLLVAYAVASTILGSTRMLLYYPVLINTILCVVFGLSLRQEEALLLRIVRARNIPLSARAPTYLNRLTAVWTVFFALNALAALWTTTASFETWTLYNGLIAYFLVAALVAIEWVFRQYYKKRPYTDEP